MRAGVVSSDRFTAYSSLAPERRQVCWSHLRRDFTFHADLGLGSQETFGLDGLEVTWNVFHAWKQFQQDGDRAALQQRVAAIKQQMRPLLEWGSTGKRQRHVRALAKNLLKLWPALWTFADVPDVEPTNNAAERGLRAAVIASSHSAAAPRTASGRSNGCSRSTRPAGCNAARSTPTSPTSSPPRPAATPSRRSADGSGASTLAQARRLPPGVFGKGGQNRPRLAGDHGVEPGTNSRTS
jgi:transposase